MSAVAATVIEQAALSPRGDLVPILSRAQRVRYLLLGGVWLALLANFWVWWLNPAHVIDPSRYGLVTIALGWITFLQLYFFLIFLRARRTAGSVEALGGARIAMIVTKTPSEPWEMVRETLIAMLAQDLPHDTWLADEDPSPETRAWCGAYGVRISTRRGVAAYHRAEWPRRTHCKEGNLAFFYDRYGYDNYDFVSQLDADHRPEPTYLRELMRPFANPEVGYVSAPSICASNAEQSWAARARLYSEAAFHGALQAGYSNGWAPMCIGSHYAVRTRALKAIGGLGPELAEDHSTSLMMNSGGWRGVHAIDAIAIGAGPERFEDMLRQEFQWSRSLFTLLLRYTFRYFGGLRPVLKFQFVFSQIWYLLFALVMAMTFIFPIWALLADVRFADVTYPAFLAYSAPPVAVLVLIAWQIRRDGLFRPKDARILSWERMLFPSAQWPWVLWGCVMAMADRLAGGFVEFAITPKKERHRDALPWRAIAPYGFLSLASVAPVLFIDDIQSAPGFYLFALFNAALYAALIVIVLWQRMNQMTEWVHVWRFRAQGVLAIALVALTIHAGWLRGPQSLFALSQGLAPISLLDMQFIAAGAGQRRGAIHYEINPRLVWTALVVPPATEEE